MFLSIDATLLVQVVNFVVFIILLNIVFLKPVGAAIAKRRAYIDGLTKDVETAQHDVRSLRTQAEDARAAARRDAESAIVAARADALNGSVELTTEYQARAAAIIAQAHSTVANEVSAARADENRIVEALARDLVDRAVGTGASA
jgi:F-type H+-transporting ATPase subunit b